MCIRDRKKIRQKILKKIRFFANKRGYIITKVKDNDNDKLITLNFSFYFDTQDYSPITLFMSQEVGIFS